jgi:hypothetical protein
MDLQIDYAMLADYRFTLCLSKHCLCSVLVFIDSSPFAHRRRRYTSQLTSSTGHLRPRQYTYCVTSPARLTLGRCFLINLIELLHLHCFPHHHINDSHNSLNGLHFLPRLRSAMRHSFSYAVPPKCFSDPVSEGSHQALHNGK